MFFKALKDHNDNIGKLSPYLLQDDPQVVAAFAQKAVDSACKIRLQCVATRWEIHFIAIWKSTLRNQSKRVSRISKLNDWLSQQKGDIEYIVPAFFKAAQEAILAGEDKKK